MNRWLILAAAALLFLMSGMASAATVSVNSQGAGNDVPISVSGTAVTVLPFSTARFGWTLFSETVDIRCEWGTPANGVPTTTPTATRGFLFKSGTSYSFGAGIIGQHTGNPYLPIAQLRLDCISTGAATNVDTTESISATP